MEKILNRAAVFGVLLIAGTLGLASRPSPANNRGRIQDRADRLCIVSLNLAKEPDAAKVRQDLENAPCRTVDVFLLQEVAREAGQPSVAEKAGTLLGYRAAFWAPPGVSDQGLAILSRFPLQEFRIIRLQAYDLKFHSRERFTLSTVAETPRGDLRLWDVHLDTRINPAERVEQLGPVLRAADTAKEPSLIGGDFNTIRFRWLGNVIPYPGVPSQVTAVRRAMAGIGFRTPFADGTSTFPFLQQHLDWLFGRDVTAVDSGTYPTRYSDHQAIWATFQISARADGKGF